MIRIGLIEWDGGGDVGLAAAARRHPDVSVSSIALELPVPDGLDALIVDAPIAKRSEIIKHLVGTTDLRIFAEAPVGLQLTDPERVISANPLRYGLHTSRLIEEVQRPDDTLETIFAAWRFRSSAHTESRLSALIDFVRALHKDEVIRATACQRREPYVLLATLRYATGAIVTLELGDHLPVGFPSDSELLVECFSAERAYHCTPGNQSVVSYGVQPAWVDWQPHPADVMLNAFLAWLNGASRPVGSVADDLIALELSERIRRAAR